MQYQLEGNFNMLPFKFFPTFLPKHTISKMDVYLKVTCKLPETNRAKYLRVIFVVPHTVTKVWFSNMQPGSTSTMEDWNKVAQSIMNAAAGYAGKSGSYALPTGGDNGKANYEPKKRKVTWEIKDFKGG